MLKVVYIHTDIAKTMHIMRRRPVWIDQDVLKLYMMREPFENLDAKFPGNWGDAPLVHVYECVMSPVFYFIVELLDRADHWFEANLEKLIPLWLKCGTFSSYPMTGRGMLNESMRIQEFIIRWHALLEQTVSEIEKLDQRAAILLSTIQRHHPSPFQDDLEKVQLLHLCVLMAKPRCLEVLLEGEGYHFKSVWRKGIEIKCLLDAINYDGYDRRVQRDLVPNPHISRFWPYLFAPTYVLSHWVKNDTGDYNIQLSCWGSLLHWAVKHNYGLFTVDPFTYIHLLKLLIENLNVNKELKDEYGHTALSVFEAQHHHEDMHHSLARTKQLLGSSSECISID